MHKGTAVKFALLAPGLPLFSAIGSAQATASPAGTVRHGTGAVIADAQHNNRAVGELHVPNLRAHAANLAVCDSYNILTSNLQPHDLRGARTRPRDQ
jgi:hypothetical protein